MAHRADWRDLKIGIVAACAVVTVSLSADNVYRATRFFGQDPQTTITPGAFVMPGVSDFKYPNNRQYLFNIDFRF